MKIHTIGSDIYASQPSNAMMPPLPSLPPPPEIEASLEEEKVFQYKGEGRGASKRDQNSR